MHVRAYTYCKNIQLRLDANQNNANKFTDMRNVLQSLNYQDNELICKLEYFDLVILTQYGYFRPHYQTIDNLHAQIHAQISTNLSLFHDDSIDFMVIYIEVI